MTPELLMSGLHIDSPLVSPDSANYRPSIWPPPPNFPVVINQEGITECVFGDSTWNLARWEGKTCSIPFGDGSSKGIRISRGNADLLRQIAGWWLWGPSPVQTANALKARVAQIRPIAAICSDQNILISELSRFPKVIDHIASCIRSSDGYLTIGLLTRLLAHRETLGFMILDEDGIKRLSGKIPNHKRVQTPYIPPRIWAYQIHQLRNFLDDYLKYKNQISELYSFCIEAYRSNAGSWESLFSKQLKRNLKPFGNPTSSSKGHTSPKYYGSFLGTAQRFGVDSLFKRWVKDHSIAGFTELFNMVRETGTAYILNFSLMRVDEGGQLRAGCYTIEKDTLNQDIHMLSSATSKTIDDSDARWICSPSVNVAIEAMTHVAQLRMTTAQHNPNRNWSPLDYSKPRLWSHGEEPWSKGNDSKGVRGRVPEYARVVSRRSKVFDPEQLRITQEDLNIAQAMTLGLDTDKFAVGKVWPLAWHQLRRTGVCNMLSSGIVSERSLRYQLKHLSVTMTRYYGQNYFRLKSSLNAEAQGFFLKEMYDAISRGFSELRGENFISPHGQKRKNQILRPISDRDHNDLAKAAKSGKIVYRKTLLGACTQSTCIYGGITNITACMGKADKGEKPCENLIINKDRRDILVNLIADFENQIGKEPQESPIRQSLIENQNAAKEAINVIDREKN